jgi:hypothetical protein
MGEAMHAGTNQFSPGKPRFLAPKWQFLGLEGTSLGKSDGCARKIRRNPLPCIARENTVLLLDYLLPRIGRGILAHLIWLSACAIRRRRIPEQQCVLLRLGLQLLLG